MKTPIMLIALFIPVLTVFAQPNHIIFHQNGAVEVVPLDVDMKGAGHDHLDAIPVFSRLEDGTLSPGVIYRGISDSGHHYMKYPGGVVRHEDGRYEVEIYTWSVMHGPKGRLYERMIHGSEMAEVYDAVPAPKPNQQRGGSTLIAVYDHNGAPDELVNEELLVRRSIEIAALCRADLTGDGQFNFFDVSAFLGAFNAGCP